MADKNSASDFNGIVRRIALEADNSVQAFIVDNSNQLIAATDSFAMQVICHASLEAKEIVKVWYENRVAEVVTMTGVQMWIFSRVGKPNLVHSLECPSIRDANDRRLHAQINDETGKPIPPLATSDERVMEILGTAMAFGYEVGNLDYDDKTREIKTIAFNHPDL